MKSWQPKPLYWRLYVENDRVLQAAVKIIGYAGINGFAFYDAAKTLPCYDKYKFETAVRDLCDYAKRERGQYELHSTARRAARTLLGCPPEDPEYRSWWIKRLISNPDAVPPIPLDEPATTPVKQPVTRRRRKTAK